ncbi:MAG TPA: hypothetical protein VKS79_24255 [Gemmataceae bacterium]|nr:hypothetical protein [Gemmataceae bacterium]
MPLLDHFNPPLNRTHPWRSFHGAWAAAIARLLNHGILPEGYYAVPLMDRDGPIEIDVAALRTNGAFQTNGKETMPQTWSPPAPALAVAVELPPDDSVEVHVLADDGDPRLAAAIELVSPRNKNRPQSRQAFAAKCVTYLQQGSSVVVVDTVTTRRANLNEEILSLLHAETESKERPPGLSAVSMQLATAKKELQQLRIWPEAVALGNKLPRLPLWISPEFSVPLDLEASYTEACIDLRIQGRSDG